MAFVDSAQVHWYQRKLEWENDWDRETFNELKIHILFNHFNVLWLIYTVPWWNPTAQHRKWRRFCNKINISHFQMASTPAFGHRSAQFQIDFSPYFCGANGEKLFACEMGIEREHVANANFEFVSVGWLKSDYMNVLHLSTEKCDSFFTLFAVSSMSNVGRGRETKNNHNM